MNIIRVFDFNHKNFIFFELKKDITIGDIKNIFAKNKDLDVKNIIAYDSFNMRFDIFLDDNIKFDKLIENGFSKENDYIIFKYK